MSFIEENYLGPDDFGLRKGSGIVILHTTETAGTTLYKAKQLAYIQASGRLAGSYNKIICTDGILTTVPDDHISGGVNPFSDFWSPEAWLYDFLPAYMVNDPNSYALELSFMGTKATYDSSGWPPQMIDAAARLILAEERRIGKGVVVANHEDWQTNRSDAGPIATSLVMARYRELANQTLPDTSTEEEEVIDPDRHAPPVTILVRGGTVYKDEDRATGSYGLAQPGRYGLYGLPVSPETPTGKASLAPIHWTGNVIGWVGYDQLDLGSIQPAGWSCPPVGYTEAQYNQNYLDGVAAGQAEAAEEIGELEHKIANAQAALA